MNPPSVLFISHLSSPLSPRHPLQTPLPVLLHTQYKAAGTPQVPAARAATSQSCTPSREAHKIPFRLFSPSRNFLYFSAFIAQLSLPHFSGKAPRPWWTRTQEGETQLSPGASSAPLQAHSHPGGAVL